MHFLGLDIGTSAVKAVLVDGGQAAVARAAVPLSIASPRPSWFEQDPDDWWRATESAVAELRRAAPAAFADIRAIGLSGQMHGAVALGADGQALRPAILWNDARATAECAALAEAVPDIAAIAGVKPMPGFTAPKLLWLRRHEPEIFAQLRHIVLAKDFVRLKLTGDVATDMVDAAGTLMLDEARRAWSEPIVAAVGLQPEMLPRLLEGNAPSGHLRSEIAAAWGIAHPVVMAAGGGDVAAGAVGTGVVNGGDRLISLGTSAQIFIARERYWPRPETLIHCFAHALPQRWFEMAALLNGGSCLDWLARLLGAEPAALLAGAEGAFRGAPSPVLFLPHLAGERTPIDDPDARGAFANLDFAATRADLIQAVLDGVALSLMDGFNALGEAVDAESIPVVGGGGRSLFWLRLIAAALGRPLTRFSGADDGPAFGAARLARLALTGEAVSDVCTRPPVAETIMPDAVLSARYAARLPAYRALTASLREVRGATAGRRLAATR